MLTLTFNLSWLISSAVISIHENKDTAGEFSIFAFRLHKEDGDVDVTGSRIFILQTKKVSVKNENFRNDF